MSFYFWIKLYSLEMSLIQNVDWKNYRLSTDSQTLYPVFNTYILPKKNLLKNWKIEKLLPEQGDKIKHQAPTIVYSNIFKKGYFI